MPGTPATTPRHGAPRYSTADPATLAAILNAIVDTFDATAPRWLTPAVFSSRPAASIAGRLFFATDRFTLYRDNGSAWEVVTVEDGAITTAKVADDAVTAAKIGPDAGLVPIGAQLSYTGDVEPGDTGNGIFLFADGRLVSQATYPAYFAKVGHKYNGGVDPGGGNFKLPDKRGRVSVGADNFGTAAGAAGRLPNSNRVTGQNGGEERHLNLYTESGSPAHAHSDTIAVAAANAATSGYQAWLSTGGYTTNNVQDVTGPTGVYMAQALGTIGYNTLSHAHTVTGGVSNSANVNAAAAHNNLQPYEVDTVIVRVK